MCLCHFNVATSKSKVSFMVLFGIVAHCHQKWENMIIRLEKETEVCQDVKLIIQYPDFYLITGSSPQ